MRLFVAFEVPQPLRREVARRAREVAPELPAARWVPAANLHLTLIFLGEVEAERRQTLATSLRRCFARHGPTELALEGAGTFPPERPGRVGWIGVRHEPDLETLGTDLRVAAERALERPLEARPFRAHLTVARCGRPWPREAAERFAESFPGRVGEPFTVRDGLLFRSRLGAGGARYSIADRFHLAGCGGRLEELGA